MRNGFPDEYDFSDTDCPDECEPGQCTRDETFPTAAVVIGCIVVAAFLAAVCAAWRAWA